MRCPTHRTPPPSPSPLPLPWLWLWLALGLGLLALGTAASVESASTPSPSATADTSTDATVGETGPALATDEAASTAACPLDCNCRGGAEAVVDCRAIGIHNVSAHLLRWPLPATVKLDLSHNDISHLGASVFAGLPDLEDLNLAGNPLTSIDQGALHLPRLRFLSLQSTKLSHIPSSLLSNLPNLNTLRLDLNGFDRLEPTLFQGLASLRHLRLDVNQLTAVPRAALAPLQRLEILNVSFNKIKGLPAEAFANLSSLVALDLDYNDIEVIDDAAFVGLHSLKILELRHNQIKQLPNYFQQLPLLYELYLSNNKITEIKAGVFQQVPRITFLELRGNPLLTVEKEAFSSLPRLQKLILSEVKELRLFPSLNGSSALELVRIDRAKIKSLPSDLCKFVPHLRSLDVKSNMIENLPDFSHCRNLRLLDMSHNKISELGDHTFQHLVHLHDLLMSHNSIHNITAHTFAGLHKLKTLDLGDNLIDEIHPDAFLPLGEVQDINLGHNHFATLPSVGLENALHIKVHNNPNLREFPLPTAFPRVQTLALSYAYHCCPFQNPDVLHGRHSGHVGDSSLRDSVIFPSSDHEIDLNAWAKGETTFVDTSVMWSNLSQQWANIAAMANNGNLTDAEVEELLNGLQLNVATDAAAGGLVTANVAPLKRRAAVTCIPEPSPFMPCQDLFDWWSLRCGVWLVFLMALLGNGAVVFVLIFARSKMDVPRFLVCNLGMADFFMGIYLGFLAVVDASTLGEFRMYAIPWQFSAGCQVAGFFGVLSSELSVYTLAVITMERNYAITHAMHLNKRLSLRHASYIMTIGWFFALIMALLPLVGVSDYRKFAVCLPFEVGNSVSKGYVIFLMFINGVAFLILMGCYLKMYCAIRGSQAWNSNDSRIAKRMALLVFTDFLCWAPIAFFSLTAAFGVQFVSLEEAKVFTVFILPLNSCCNPFLYAILTKQFKKDCVMICKAIEESRVTRGIGRCRHSSNFSNRPTPGNTNSVGDRNSNSKDGSSCQCQSRLIDKPRSRHRTAARWLRSPIRALLRRVRAADQDLDSSSSANEYAYQIAEIQQKQQHRKHRRAESVSSDNFSSSRSDSVKAIGCGLPMRMTGRRRNSWTVTRKPSSDSNLSSSRNDSSTSAMTGSTSIGTAAWRTSRSSVSSDGGSSFKGSIKVKDRLQTALTKSEAAPVEVVVVSGATALPAGQRRSSSIREKTLRQLPTSPLAAGILRQQSVATPTGSVVQRTVPYPMVVVSKETGAGASSAGGGVKAKPRLTRQAAIQDEVYQPATTTASSTSPSSSSAVASTSKSVSFDVSVANKGSPGPYCPLHRTGRGEAANAQFLQGVWESSIEEDDEFGCGSGRESPLDSTGVDRQSLYQAVVAIYTNRDKNRLGLSGFIPRKLSTISSRSCSINPEHDTEVASSGSAEEEATDGGGGSGRASPPSSSAAVVPASSCELLQGVAAVHAPARHHQHQQRLLSKSDNELYCPPTGAGRRSAPSSGASVHFLPDLRPEAGPIMMVAFAPMDHNCSFEMIDDGDDDDVFQDPQQQQQQQRQQQQEEQQQQQQHHRHHPLETAEDEPLLR